jgi:hypothetical protein
MMEVILYIYCGYLGFAWVTSEDGVLSQVILGVVLAFIGFIIGSGKVNKRFKAGYSSNLDRDLNKSAFILLIVCVVLWADSVVDSDEEVVVGVEKSKNISNECFLSVKYLPSRL